ncbi:MAG: IS66 family transposase [Acidimicrobiales bacterium]
MTTSSTVPGGPRAGRRSQRDELKWLRAECASLRDQLKLVSGERDRLRTDCERLRAELEVARRAEKRQAAPFSKGTKKPDPAAPGRKPGEAYGKKARRLPPPLEEIDEVIGVGLPGACPACGGEVVFDKTLPQYQDELIVKVLHRRFDVDLGHCACCAKAVRGRHPEQTSDALGAAGSMLGPRALAFAAWLKVGCGVPASKVAKVLSAAGGISVTPGGLTQAIERLAADAEGAYAGLVEALRSSRVVSPDETGWRIDATRGWLWVYVGDTVTVYDIAPGRGYEHAAAILGEEFSGMLCRDGWAPYRHFSQATHQSCAAHLLRRANEMIVDARGGQARIPHALRRLLLDALALRDRRDAGEIDGDELEEAIAALEARVEALCAAKPTYAPNARLIKHLVNEKNALLAFLRAPGTPATNHNAERAIRPMVCNRKQWGGNKTWVGARATSVLASVCRTADQQHLDPLDVLYSILTTDGAVHGLDLRPPPADP